MRSTTKCLGAALFAFTAGIEMGMPSIAAASTLQKADGAAQPHNIHDTPYNGDSAAAYARHWATSYNSNYAQYSPTDCTSFVSQSLINGGLSYVNAPLVPTGSDYNTSDWWYFNYGTPGAHFQSSSWDNAGALKDFLTAAPSELGYSLKDYYAYDAPTVPQGWYMGDIVFYDWQGASTPGEIDHSAIKTGNTNYADISQHSVGLLNVPYTYEGVSGTGGSWNPVSSQLFLVDIYGNSAQD
jgi:hypothetical protein